jgi:succinylglutamate desuccinylase
MKSKIEILNKGGGERVVLQCLVHGDEIIGKLVLDEVKSKIEHKQILKEIVFIEANLEAYKQNKRFIDVDLNRQMTESKQKSLHSLNSNELNHEESIAVNLSSILAGASYLLDIHATKSPSKPFIYSLNTKKHKDIISVLNVDLVVLTQEGDEPIGAMDEFVDSHNGVGFTLEAGGIGDNHYTKDMVKLVMNFLCKSNAISMGNIDLPTIDKKIVKSKYFYAPSDNFVFSKKFKNFDLLKKGELIGSFNGKKYTVDHDVIILFVYPIKKNKPCLVFGEEI